MTADDPDRPRKTLTLNKSASRATPSKDEDRRKRSGARARAVALRGHEQDKTQNAAAPSEHAPGSESERSPGRGADRRPARDSDRRPARDSDRRPARDSDRRPARDSDRAPARASGRGPAGDPDRGPARSSDRGPARSSERGAARSSERRPARASDDRGPVQAQGGRPGREEAGQDRQEPAQWQASRDEADTRDDRPEAPARHERTRESRRAARAAEIFSVFAPCPQGIEEALTAEMQALGFEDAQAGRAGCHFTADWMGVQRANLYSRLATRMLVQVAHGPVQHEDDLLDLAYATPWERWFGAEHTLRVDTSAIKSPMRSLQYCNLRVKDGICDRLLDREGARPDIDTVRPHARVHSFLTADTATLYLDTSGESLFKRGWRLDKGEAPLRENLAAGMLALAGWDPAMPLLDPFCGSGTILIEAAWIALGVPPGIARPFGFERLRGHDAKLWHALKDDARAHILPQLDTPLYGCDLDPDAIAYARNNAERAWLTEGTIQFEIADARALEAPEKNGWIVTNPPYGERMPSGPDDTLWRDWATCLKRQFGGWQLHVISSDMTLPQQMRLKPQRRTPLHNGSLDCRLFGFELVSAGYRDKQGAGGGRGENGAAHGAHEDENEDESHGGDDSEDNV